MAEPENYTWEQVLEYGIYSIVNSVADIDAITDDDDHSANWSKGAMFNAALALLMADQASKLIAQGDLDGAAHSIRRADPFLTFLP